MKQVEILSQAAWGICTPQELRNFMRLDDGETDETLLHYITAASSLFEEMTYYTLQKKHYQVTYENMDRVKFHIAHRPLRTILSVTRGERILQPDAYLVKDQKIYLDDYSDYSLSVEYEAGFETVDDVPASLKHIIMMCAADLYLYRLSDAGHYGFTDRILDIIALYTEKSL